MDEVNLTRVSNKISIVALAMTAALAAAIAVLVISNSSHCGTICLCHLQIRNTFLSKLLIQC